MATDVRQTGSYRESRKITYQPSTEMFATPDTQGLVSELSKMKSARLLGNYMRVLARRRAFKRLVQLTSLPHEGALTIFPSLLPQDAGESVGVKCFGLPGADRCVEEGTFF